MSEHPDNLVDARDGVIVGDIHISQDIRQNAKCTRCNSVSPEIISCRQCRDLFSCSVCKNEVESIKKKLIRTFPQTLANLVEKHLDRTCEKCISKYNEDNNLQGLNKILQLRQVLFALCDTLFDEENYVWPKMENHEWAPYRYEMLKEHEFFSTNLADMGEILPKPLQNEQPLAKIHQVYSLFEYLNQRLENLRELMLKSFANFKNVERKKGKSVPFQPKFKFDGKYLLTLQYSKIYDDPPRYMFQMDSFFQSPINLNSDLTASERFPYSEAKEILLKQGWTFDFEIEVGKLTYRNIPTKFMCFFKH